MTDLLFFTDAHDFEQDQAPNRALPFAVWSQICAAHAANATMDGTYHHNGSAYTVTSLVCDRDPEPVLYALHVAVRRNDAERALIAVETAERIARRALHTTGDQETRELLGALIDSTSDCTASVVNDQTLSDRISREAGERTASYLGYR